MSEIKLRKRLARIDGQLDTLEGKVQLLRERRGRVIGEIYQGNIITISESYYHKKHRGRKCLVISTHWHGVHVKCYNMKESGRFLPAYNKYGRGDLKLSLTLEDIDQEKGIIVL